MGTVDPFAAARCICARISVCLFVAFSYLIRIVVISMVSESYAHAAQVVG